MVNGVLIVYYLLHAALVFLVEFFFNNGIRQLNDSIRLSGLF